MSVTLTPKGWVSAALWHAAHQQVLQDPEAGGNYRRGVQVKKVTGNNSSVALKNTNSWVVMTACKEGIRRDASRCPPSHAISADEELHQYGSKSFWGDIMRLTFQGTKLRVGEGACQRLRGVVHEGGTRSFQQ